MFSHFYLAAHIIHSKVIKNMACHSGKESSWERWVNQLIKPQSWYFLVWNWMYAWNLQTIVINGSALAIWEYSRLDCNYFLLQQDNHERTLLRTSVEEFCFLWPLTSCPQAFASHVYQLVLHQQPRNQLSLCANIVFTVFNNVNFKKRGRKQI